MAELRLSQVAVFLPGERQALFRVPKLEVAPHERLLVHGPSGRGKTTLLHLLAGLLLPAEGDVYFGDRNLRFLSDEQRCDLRRHEVGIVFQRLNLLDHLTVRENVLLTAPRGTNSAATDDVLRRLGLTACAERRAAWLSLGEQQRTAVARVVLARPRLILADEPTSSLDNANARAVIEALLGLPDRPAIVTVSHDARIRSAFSRVLAFEELCG